MAGQTDSAVIAAADFQELGDHLVERLTPLVDFQRFNIGLIDETRYMFTDAFVSGQNVAGRAVGHERTLDGTVVERAIQAGDGAFFGGDVETLRIVQNLGAEVVDRIVVLANETAGG